MDSRIPTPRQGFELAVLEGENLLYCHGTTTMISLNGSAAAIWQLCDGERTIEDIVTLFAEAFPDAARTVHADVPKIIDELVASDVLSWT